MKTRRYPYTTEEAAASINRYYARAHGVQDAWERGARGFNTEDINPTGQCAIACTFLEHPRKPGFWREIPYGNTISRLETQPED